MLPSLWEFDRNYYSRVSRISNLGLIYSRVGMGFLDPLAESYDINRYKKEHELRASVSPSLACTSTPWTRCESSIQP